MVSEKEEKIVCIPDKNDVLCGRGGEIHNRAGNIRYRAWVKERREAYSLCNKKDKKMNYAHEVVNLVKTLDPPGRFLQRSITDPSQWLEITDERALHKTSQALREGAPAIRAKAKQKQEVGRPAIPMTPLFQPTRSFFPLHPPYGSYHQPHVPLSTTSDSILFNRLNKVESMLGNVMHHQKHLDFRAQKYLHGQPLLETLYSTPRRQDDLFKKELATSKQALLEDIEKLRREVAVIGHFKKHTLNFEQMHPVKKARVRTDLVPSDDIARTQLFKF